MSDEQVTTSATTPEATPAPAAPETAAPAETKDAKPNGKPHKLVGEEHASRKKSAKQVMAEEMAKARAASEKPAAEPKGEEKAAEPATEAKSEPAAEAAPPEPEKQAEAKPAEEAPAPPETPPIPKTDDKGKPIKASIVAQAERMRRQAIRAAEAARADAERARAEREQAARERAQYEQKLREREEQEQAWLAEARRDPDGAMAKRLGIDRRSLLAKKVDAQGQLQAQELPAPVAAELAEIKRQLAEREQRDRQQAEATKRAREEAEVRAVQERHQANIRSDIAKMIDQAKADPDEQYEHFAALDRDVQEARTRRYMDKVLDEYLRTGMKYTPEDILYNLERDAREEADRYEALRAKKRAVQKAPAPTPPAPPAKPKPAADAAPRAPTQKDASVPAAPAAPQTHAERKRRAIAEVNSTVQESYRR